MVRLAGIVFLLAATAWAAPGGRVVRVERNRGIKTIPRLCDITPSSKEGLCVGQPVQNERVTLIDQDRGVAIGEFRIDSTAAPDAPFSCSGVAPMVFKVKGVVAQGDPDVIDAASRIVGLRNLHLDPNVARVMKDQLVPGTQDRAELALDSDGNGTLDYMLFRYGCDEAGNVMPTADRRFCFDTYLERAGKLVKVHTDNIQICF